jgi:rhamnose utilization protein RhaD (predicted bifunctional aldolase and dehydrogenase)
MYLKKLSAIWSASYPEDAAARESAVLADLMASRFAGEETKRPSVETLLHDILPYAYVVHTHPALVNGVTCSARGELLAKELFADDVLWIPSTNPGYILSGIVRDAYRAHTSRTGKHPSFILLQNHGIFVASNTVEGIEKIYERVMTSLSSRVIRKPDFRPVQLTAGQSASSGQAVRLLERLAAKKPAASASVFFALDSEIFRLVASRESFSAVASPFTPDHIVYAGSDFLFSEGLATLEKEYESFVLEHHRIPKMAAVRGLGVFGIGSADNEKSARLAVELFRDAVKVSVYTESFGGPKTMTAEQIDFINNWEVEQYRSKISVAGK